MQPEVRIQTQNLTIYQGLSVLVTNGMGEVEPTAQQGFFCQDTRFLSRYDFVINGVKWLLVQATPLRPFSNRLHFTNPELGVMDEPAIPANSLGFRIDRRIGGGLHEDLTLTNYSGRKVKLRLRIRLDADFADIFDIRAQKYVSRGLRDSIWDGNQRQLRVLYHSADFFRELIFSTLNSDPQPHFSNGQILYEIELAPGAAWHTCNMFTLIIGGVPIPPSYPCAVSPGGEVPIDRDRLHDNWTAAASGFICSDYRLQRMYHQAVDDIGGLRIPEYDVTEEVWVPAAGVPWFVTLFGRDSLIVACQTMMVSQGLALGPLAKLAQFQATVIDDYRDAEPGKIMHEIRFGELAHLRKIPHTPYYGSADATALYLILLSEYYRWSGDRRILERYRETAMRCLSWIDRFGDRDGDGFQEYQRRLASGYYNQSWKDSGDCIVYPDGQLVGLPIATCELQGYVYDAKRRMAEAFEATGKPDLADRLRQEAAELRRAFHRDFYLPGAGYIALCLDGRKRPVETIASNAGHCLWSGIAEPEAAAAVARRVFMDDMWTGWGVRTLSADNPAYNPLEYHRGSVWPHDNALLAAGLARYGYREESNRVASAIVEAAGIFAHLRLPELFAGFARRENPFPVQYRGANVPQAWASGSIPHLLRTILGINPDAARRTLYVDPALPEWMEQATLHNLQVGNARISLEFKLSGGRSQFEVLRCTERDLKVEAGPPPYFAQP